MWIVYQAHEMSRPIFSEKILWKKQKKKKKKNNNKNTFFRMSSATNFAVHFILYYDYAASVFVLSRE